LDDVRGSHPYRSPRALPAIARVGAIQASWYLLTARVRVPFKRAVKRSERFAQRQRHTETDRDKDRQRQTVSTPSQPERLYQGDRDRQTDRNRYRDRET